MALRYRQRMCPGGGLRAAPGGSSRFLLFGALGIGGLGRGAYQTPSADGPTARSDGLARLEAVLFLSRGPQTSRKLAHLAGLADGTEARTLVRKLNRLYDAEGSSFRVEEVAGGFQLMTRSKFAPWLRRLHNAPVEIRLSVPAMETLAVVAYRQPVLRAEIEAIRGVQCGEILRQLIERELVRIVGRSEELGRPFLYGTTRQFLQIFGLRHLDELPRRELLQAAQPGPAGTVAVDGAETDQQGSLQPNRSDQVEEETEVTTAATAGALPEGLPDENAPTVSQAPRDEQPNDKYPFDDDHDDEGHPDECDEDEDDEDEDDLEDEPWEEVEGDDEDEDEEEDEEDWDEEDDEDWDDDDWGDEDEDKDEEE